MNIINLDDDALVHIMEFLSDYDKIIFTSTCKRLNTLKFIVPFSEFYFYNNILKHKTKFIFESIVFDSNIRTEFENFPYLKNVKINAFSKNIKVECDIPKSIKKILLCETENNQVVFTEKININNLDTFYSSHSIKGDMLYNATGDFGIMYDTRAIYRTDNKITGLYVSGNGKLGSCYIKLTKFKDLNLVGFKNVKWFMSDIPDTIKSIYLQNSPDLLSQLCKPKNMFCNIVKLVILERINKFELKYLPKKLEELKIIADHFDSDFIIPRSLKTLQIETTKKYRLPKSQNLINLIISNTVIIDRFNLPPTLEYVEINEFNETYVNGNKSISASLPNLKK